MSKPFSERPAREIAAEALTYRRPTLAGTPDVRAFAVTQDQINAANAKRDAKLAQARDRFKRQVRVTGSEQAAAPSSPPAAEPAPR